MAVVASAAFAGCGGGGDDVKLSPQIEAALKYLPEDSAVVAVVPTDFKSGPLQQLDDLGEANVKGWDKIKQQIIEQVSENGGQSQVDAIFGNPLAVSQSGPDSDNQNIAIQIQNPTAAKQSFQAQIDKGDAKQLPAYKGAFLWEDTKPSDEGDDTNFNGLKGNMLFAAGTQQLLQQAIDNAEGSDNANSNNDFKSKIADMGDGSLLRVVGDAQQLLENGGNSEKALKVKFVKALGLFWFKSTVTTSGIDGETIVETNNEDLSESEIPFTTKSVSLTLPSSNALAGVALADPDQLVKFALATAQQVNPESSGQIDQALGQLKSAAGIDLNKDLIGQMQQVAVAITGKDQYEFRAQLADGEQFGQNLTKTQTFLQGPLQQNDLSLTVEGSGDNVTYVVLKGKQEAARFAIKGDTLVGSVGPVGDLPSPSLNEPIEGTGALGLESDVAKLLKAVPDSTDQLQNDQLNIDAGDKLGRDIASSLGPTTQVLSETTEQITIKSKLQVGR